MAVVYTHTYPHEYILGAEYKKLPAATGGEHTSQTYGGARARAHKLERDTTLVLHYTLFLFLVPAPPHLKNCVEKHSRKNKQQLAEHSSLRRRQRAVLHPSLRDVLVVCD